MMNGRVVKSTGSWYQVMTADGKYYDCRIKGKFRLEDSKLTNPVAVGDMVDFELEENETTVGIINKIKDRKNYLIRRSNKLSKQFQIIASNVDQIILLATIAKPRTTTVFIDRVLLAAEAYAIPTILVFNKKDIYSNAQNEILNEYCSIYQPIGYKVKVMTAFNNEDIEELRGALINKVSLITGHSGVGKSTVLNKLNPNLGLKTGELSKYHARGTHNTTFAEMHFIQENTYIIDTPGIKDFGVVEFEEDNISMYFKDIQKFAVKCRFNNCRHVDEPDCKVRWAVEQNQVSITRFQSYLNILFSYKTES